MKLLILSFKLFVTGIRLRLCKYRFDRIMLCRMLRGAPVTDKQVNILSVKFYTLTKRFKELEDCFFRTADIFDRHTI